MAVGRGIGEGVKVTVGVGVTVGGDVAVGGGILVGVSVGGVSVGSRGGSSEEELQAEVTASTTRYSSKFVRQCLLIALRYYGASIAQRKPKSLRCSAGNACVRFAVRIFDASLRHEPPRIILH